MATRRDYIIGAIIAFVFISAFGFIGLMFVGVLGSGEMDLSAGTGNVAVVEVNGAIDETLGRTVIKQLDHWAEYSSVKSIVLHVNSPGGGVSISQEVYDAVRRAQETKPVVVSMASVAASGGYYIACGGEMIVANPGTITGSIGVIFQFYTAKDLLDKIGVGTEVIKSGELKDIGSFSRDMTEKEASMMRAVVMDSYEQFVEVVAKGRGKQRDEVYPLADGSIFTGQMAYNLGLVDTLGGLEEAVNIAADLGGVEDPKIVRQTERKPILSLWDILTGDANVALDRLTGTAVENFGPQILYLYK
jgi:protease IV